MARFASVSGPIAAVVVLFALGGCGKGNAPPPVAMVTHHANNPWAIDAKPQPATAAPVALALARDGTGQFHVDAQVNGETAKFLIDTGADTVAIGESEANRLGIVPDEASFEPILQTASGRGMAARVTLERLTVGNRELDGVSAVVVRGLPINLLGQNALRRLGKVSLSGDTMTIEPD